MIKLGRETVKIAKAEEHSLRNSWFPGGGGIRAAVFCGALLFGAAMARPVYASETNKFPALESVPNGASGADGMGSAIREDGNGESVPSGGEIGIWQDGPGTNEGAAGETAPGSAGGPAGEAAPDPVGGAAGETAPGPAGGPAGSDGAGTGGGPGSQSGPQSQSGEAGQSIKPSAGNFAGGKSSGVEPGPGAGGAQGGGYVVRFSGRLNLYPGPSESETPVASVPDGTVLELLEGPSDLFVKVRIPESGQEGYAKFAYLKRQDAAVDNLEVYTYEQMEKDIWELRDRYPGLLHVNLAGKTADNRTLYELTMGKRDAKKHILIHAGIHARESMNPQLVMEQLETYLDFYDSGTYHGVSYEKLFGDTAIHLIPMVNPDGIAISQHGESGVRSPELLANVQNCYRSDLMAGYGDSSYWNYLRRWKSNANGVDLNRNFPGNWGVGVTRMQPSSSSYPGNEAGSELESQLLISLTEGYHPTAAISYHSMGQIIYWDLNESRYRSMNQEFAAMIQNLTGYRKMSAGKAGGGYLDWLLLRDRPVFSVTIETGSGSCPLPFSQYPGLWLQNYLIWPATAEYVMNR